MPERDVKLDFVTASDEEDVELARRVMREAIRDARGRAIKDAPVRRPQNLEEVDPHLGLIVRDSRVSTPQ